MSAPEEQGSMCDRLIDVFDLLHIYFIPTIVLVGVLCNMLNVVVFKSTYLRRRSSSYYLAALSLSDACFLVTLGLIWVGDTFDVDTFNKDGWCQSVVYLSTTSSFLSVWLTVGFTTERFVAVRYPLLKTHICTVAKAKVAVLCLVLVALLLNSYGIFTAGVVRRSNGLESCDVKPHFRDVLKIITVADSVMTLIIPSVLIGVMNTVILHCLIKFRNQFKLGGVENDESSPSISIPMANVQGNSRPLNFNSNTAENLRRTSAHLSGLPKDLVRPSPHSILVTKTQRSVTKMLLLTSTIFLVFNMPSYLIRLYIFLFYSMWEAAAPTNLWCVQQFCMLLFYTNFGINFLLYSFYGATFRRCLIQLLRRKLRCLCSHKCAKH